METKTDVAMNQELWQALEAGKKAETDSSPQLPDFILVFLDFSPVELVLDF